MLRPLLLTAALLPLAASAAPMKFDFALGGESAKPLQVGTIAYVSTGAIVNAYDYESPAAPVLLHRTSKEPAPGVITSITHHGNYLYATYQTDMSAPLRNGVAVYSLANPSRPRLVNIVNNYNDAALREPSNVLVHDGRLYLFDRESGIYISDLADPVHLRFSHAVQHPVPAAGVNIQQNRLYAVGRTFAWDHVISIFDLTDPSTPEWIGEAWADGGYFADFVVRAPFAAAFGLGIEIHDLSVPELPDLVGVYDDGASVYFSGVLLEQHAVAFGEKDLHVYDISNPAQLGAPKAFAIDTFGAENPLVVDSDVLVPTRTDRLLRISASEPAEPRLLSSQLIAGTSTPHDIAFNRGRAYTLSNIHGLQIASGSDLEPIGDHELPAYRSPQARAYEQLVIKDDVAFVASWGSGLYTVDLSSPDKPAPLGHLAYDFATGIDVVANTAYLTRTTNGGAVSAVDVSDPTNPILLGSIVSTKPISLVATASHVFVADRGGSEGAGGLRVIEARDPTQLRQVARYRQDCPSATDVTLSEDAQRAYVACGNDLHIVDVSNPAAPQQIGVGQSGEGGGSVNPTVTVAGSRAWSGLADGIVEYDISAPEAPVVVRKLPLPWEPKRLRFAPDGRLIAPTGRGGVHVFSPASEVPPEHVFADGFE